MAWGILRKSTCAAVIALLPSSALAQDADDPAKAAPKVDQSDAGGGEAGESETGESEQVFKLQPGRMAPPSRVDQHQASDTLPSVLAILAHPDDEIMITPILSRIARAGGEVTIAFITSGAANPGVSGLEPGAELAALREDEARCSAFAMGLPEPEFWQFEDSAVEAVTGTPSSDIPDNDAPDNGRPENDRPEYDRAAMGGRIADLIALHSPQMVMTWGPEGDYRDPDHLAVSRAVGEAVLAIEEDRPELLYSAIPTNSDTDVAAFEGWATLDASLITDRIAYEFVDLETARLAIDCYQSQYTEEARALLPSILHNNVWRGTVSFRLAFEEQR